MPLTPEGQAMIDEAATGITFDVFQRPPRRQPLPPLNWLQRKIAGRVINDLDRQVIAQDGYINQQDALMEGVKAKIGEYNDILTEKDAKINEADAKVNEADAKLYQYVVDKNSEMQKLIRERDDYKKFNEILKKENAQYRVQLGIQTVTVPHNRRREKPNTDDSEGSQSVDNAPDT